MKEQEGKLTAIQGLLAKYKLDGLLLSRVSSFAWATCGAASYVNTAASEGTATLLITPSARHLITTSIEATRLEQEEKLKTQGWEFHVSAWHASSNILARLNAAPKWSRLAARPYQNTVRFRFLFTP